MCICTLSYAPLVAPTGKKARGPGGRRQAAGVLLWTERSPYTSRTLGVVERPRSPTTRATAWLWDPGSRTPPGPRSFLNLRARGAYTRDRGTHRPKEKRKRDKETNPPRGRDDRNRARGVATRGHERRADEATRKNGRRGDRRATTEGGATTGTNRPSNSWGLGQTARGPSVGWPERSD